MANEFKESIKCASCMKDWTDCICDKVEKEFNLSEKLNMIGVHGDNCRCPIRINQYTLNKITEDIKEFIKRTEEENSDLQDDIFDLVEIEHDQADLEIKLHRLFKAHKEERDKLAGDKLI